MTIQAQDLPWHLLSRHLEPRFSLEDQIKPKEYNKAPKPDLRYREDGSQEEDLKTFSEAVKDAIQKAATEERKRFPPHYSEPGDDDVLIPDDVAEQIVPMVRRWRARDFGDDETELLLRLSDEEAYEFQRKSLDARREDLSNTKTKKDVDEPGEQDSGVTRHLDKMKGGFTWNQLCSHKEGNVGFSCGCNLPFQERQAKAFTRIREDNDCYEFFLYNAKPYFNASVTRTLILSGNMDPILRMAARKDHNFEIWEHGQQCYCCDDDLGWSLLYETALRSWIILNVFKCFPQLLPSNASPRSIQKEESASDRTELELDYRRTRTYQSMLDQCCQDTGFNDVHRDIYNYNRQLVYRPFDFDYHYENGDLNEAIEENWYKPTHTSLEMATSFTDYLAERNKKAESGDHDEQTPLFQDRQAPKLADDVVDVVERICHAHQVPQELCLNILEGVASKQESDRLPVKYDPLHPANAAEVDKYLEECWMIFVRCEMLAQEIKVDISWDMVIVRFLREIGAKPSEY